MLDGALANCQRIGYPMELTATKLSRMVPLPMDWDEQRQLLGMA